MALDPTRNELLIDVLVELLIQRALLAKASNIKDKEESE